MTFVELRNWIYRQGRYHWINARPITTRPNKRNGGTIELIWRDNNMQVERIVHNAHDVIPLHRHPRVDSYEFPLWGSGELWINRRKIVLDDSKIRWRPLFISHTRWHGGCGYERGGAFLSVQLWHIPIVGSVIDDWLLRP